jgi:hypothetical protein
MIIEDGAFGRHLGLDKFMKLVPSQEETPRPEV